MNNKTKQGNRAGFLSYPSNTGSSRKYIPPQTRDFSVNHSDRQTGVICLLSFWDGSWSSAVLTQFSSSPRKGFIIATQIGENKYFHFIFHFLLNYFLKWAKTIGNRNIIMTEGRQTRYLKRQKCLQLWNLSLETDWGYTDVGVHTQPDQTCTWTQMPGHRTPLSHSPLRPCSTLPFPPVRANAFIQFYLQLWSSWLWESR